MMRTMSSSSEKMVSNRGKRGAAVATARREMSSSPKGTERMSRTRALAIAEIGERLDIGSSEEIVRKGGIAKYPFLFEALNVPLSE
jgi:hypothetical protein